MGRTLILTFSTVLVMAFLIIPATDSTGSNVRSPSDEVYAYLGTAASIDGIVTPEDAWDEAVSSSCAMNDGMITVRAKHDGSNLYIVCEAYRVGNPVSHLFFEDDGIFPDRALDSANEDYKYTSTDGLPEDFRDAHWDSGWTVRQETGSSMNGNASISYSGSTFTSEWCIPMATWSANDINVTSNETLGFACAYWPKGGWPNGWSTDLYDPVTWGLLHVVFGEAPEEPEADESQYTLFVFEENMNATMTVNATDYLIIELPEGSKNIQVTIDVRTPQMEADFLVFTDTQLPSYRDSDTSAMEYEVALLDSNHFTYFTNSTETLYVVVDNTMQPPGGALGGATLTLMVQITDTAPDAEAQALGEMVCWGLGGMFAFMAITTTYWLLSSPKKGAMGEPLIKEGTE